MLESTLKNAQSFETRAIHSGYNSLDNGGSLNAPVCFASTFALADAQSGAEAFAGENDTHFYSRVSNPTLKVLEDRIASLDGAEAALSTSSGMGAISSVLWTFLKFGDEIIVDKTVYGCTYSFLHHGLAKFGVKIVHADLCDTVALSKLVGAKTRVIYTETISNPNMRVVDISAIARIVKGLPDCKLVVDNTYLSPALSRPIEDGADIVIHSATKYIGGHGDLIAGLISGSQNDIRAIRLLGLKDMTGAVMSPMTAMLVMRGLKTLNLRMKQHSDSALEIARRLEKHPKVEAVYYPHLMSSPYFKLAQAQFSAAGGVLAFKLYGGLSAGRALIDNVELISRAVSLGDTETLIQHPASMTHSTYTESERLEHGIDEGLVRLAVGLEHVDDILADLLKSLDLIESNVVAEPEKGSS